MMKYISFRNAARNAPNNDAGLFVGVWRGEGTRGILPSERDGELVEEDDEEKEEDHDEDEEESTMRGLMVAASFSLRESK